jgi:hypothetical protein
MGRKIRKEALDSRYETGDLRHDTLGLGPGIGGDKSALFLFFGFQSPHLSLTFGLETLFCEHGHKTKADF